MIGLVRLENLVMNHGVFLEGVGEKCDPFMHDETVERPFKEGCENGGNNKTDRGPEEEERCHGLRVLWCWVFNAIDR